MDAHRVEVLDRADDHDVVGAVADDLELELVPAAQRLLDEHLVNRRFGKAACDLAAELVGVGREAAAVAAEGEGGPDDRGCRKPFDLRDVGDDRRLRHLEAARLDRVLEELAILGAGDRVDAGADQLDAELGEDAGLVELEREIECGLAAHRRQQRIGTLAAQHCGDALEVERLEVGRVGKAGVGHDRGRVRVDDDRAVALLAQDLQRLAAGVVELARLADHDRAGADQADRMRCRYAAARTSCDLQRGPPRPSRSGSTARRAGPGPASGWNCTDRARSSG